MNKYPNTYTDISIQPAANIKKLIDEIGSERILFGTDYPFVSQAFSILSVLRATDIEQATMDKKPHYRQSAIVFLMIGIVFLLIAISVFCINRWIRYIAIAVAIIAIIYAIVSSVMIER